MAKGVATNHSHMKEQNRRAVMYELWRNMPISRTELSARTGLNKATITTIISALEEENIVVPSGSLKGGLGRSRNLLVVNGKYGICGSIIFRPVAVDVAIGNMCAEILWSGKVFFDSSDSRLDVINRVGDKLQEGLDACKTYSTNLLGIGLGTASLLRPDSNLLYAIHSINWHDIPIVDYIRDRFSVPVIADTASNNAMTYEYQQGLAKDAENAVYLSVGSGIGAGILVNGQLFHGAEGFAGDVGHFTVDPGGPLCACGKRGCWEVMASPIALKQSFKELAQLADQGDTEAISALARLGHYLGRGIANLIIVLNPELVIIGGKSTAARKWLETPCKNAVRELVWPIVWERTRIEFEQEDSREELFGTLIRVVELLF